MTSSVSARPALPGTTARQVRVHSLPRLNELFNTDSARVVFDLKQFRIYLCKLIFLDIDDCTPEACQNNATCVDVVNDFQCDCAPGFTGEFCETSKYCATYVRVSVHVSTINLRTTTVTKKDCLLHPHNCY